MKAQSILLLASLFAISIVAHAEGKPECPVPDSNRTISNQAVSDFLKALSSDKSLQSYARNEQIQECFATVAAYASLEQFEQMQVALVPVKSKDASRKEYDRDPVQSRMLEQLIQKGTDTPIELVLMRLYMAGNGKRERLSEVLFLSRFVPIERALELALHQPEKHETNKLVWIYFNRNLKRLNESDFDSLLGSLKNKFGCSRQDCEENRAAPIRERMCNEWSAELLDRQADLGALPATCKNANKS